MSKFVFVDMGTGNLHSLENAFERIGVEIVKATSSNDLTDASVVVLPGVGAFGKAMEVLKEKDLIEPLRQFALSKKKPLLGICVGLQMFADVGYEETETKGLGWISGKVSKIDNQGGKFKLPHIGWNEINIKKDSKIFKDIENKSHMYFVHSFEFIPEDKSVIIATTDYSSNIVCAAEKENIFGTQFHPEKSGTIGLKLYENFAESMVRQKWFGNYTCNRPSFWCCREAFSRQLRKANYF